MLNVTIRRYKTQKSTVLLRKKENRMDATTIVTILGFLIALYAVTVISTNEGV